MAVVYVREYSRLGREQYGGHGLNVQAPLEPAIRDQTIAIGSSSVASEEFNAETTIVLIHTDAICSIKFGTNPAASATNFRLPANATQFYCVEAGKRMKVAVITNT